jgi:hypothetical protein
MYCATRDANAKLIAAAGRQRRRNIEREQHQRSKGSISILKKETKNSCSLR